MMHVGLRRSIDPDSAVIPVAAQAQTVGSIERRMAGQRIGSENRHLNNGFDLLRLMAATMVLVGHAFALTGGVSPGFLGSPIGTIGVKIFFVTSGYLVTKSWLADPRVPAFAMRRTLRIMPALICVVLFTAFVLGPLFTALTLKLYFPSSIFYLWNIALYPVYTLPGLFANNPYPMAVNGSLWSLPAEVLMYVLTPIAIGRSIVRARLGLSLFAVCCAVAGLWFVRMAPLFPAPVFYGTSLVSLAEVAPYFQIGAICAVFALNRFARPLFSLMLLFFLQLALPSIGRGANLPALLEIALLMALPFAVISIGFMHIGGMIGRLLAKADISYGVYLYAFPVQQAVSSLFGGSIGPAGNLLLAGVPTFIFAWLSWHFIERHALRLKPRARLPRPAPSPLAQSSPMPM